MNNWLADRCQRISQQRKHPEEKNRTIWEVLQEEQASLTPLAAPFYGYNEKEDRISRTSLINYDCNQYSVSSILAGQTATVQASSGLIRVIRNGTVAGEHVR